MFLTTKGILPDNGGIGNQWFNDRAGIHARTLADTVLVLDAVKDPVHGYYDPRDPMTASVPKELIPDEPYASFVRMRALGLALSPASSSARTRRSSASSSSRRTRP